MSEFNVGDSVLTTVPCTDGLVVTGQIGRIFANGIYRIVFDEYEQARLRAVYAPSTLLRYAEELTLTPRPDKVGCDCYSRDEPLTSPLHAQWCRARSVVAAQALK